jgi:hypothetical protein
MGFCLESCTLYLVPCALYHVPLEHIRNNILGETPIQQRQIDA